MGWRIPRLGWVAVLALLGCATPYGTAQNALRQGHYEVAASHFEELLAQTPDRLDARLGLGIARYKLGAYDAAVTELRRAMTGAPRSEAAHFYLGLSLLRMGEESSAAETLGRYVALRPGTRLAGEVDRALQLMRSATWSPELRTFVAATLEDGADWEREAREAREAQLTAERAYTWPPPFSPWYLGPGPCFVTRYGRLICY